jgi:enoyl-CoA hydratase/carnithine racemase
MSVQRYAKSLNSVLLAECQDCIGFTSPFGEAVTLARTLAKNSPKAVALTKQLVLADRRERIQKFAAEVDRARIAVTESDEYRDVVQQKPGAGRART